MCMTARVKNIIFPTDFPRKHYFKRHSKTLSVAPAPLRTTAKKKYSCLWLVRYPSLFWLMKCLVFGIETSGPLSNRRVVSGRNKVRCILCFPLAVAIYCAHPHCAHSVLPLFISFSTVLLNIPASDMGNSEYCVSEAKNGLEQRLPSHDLFI